MTLLKRALFTASLALLASVAPLAVTAQSTYPNQAITMVVPQSPGGTNDIVARLIAAELAQEFNQSVVVTNRPGAGGNIGTEQVKRATPDGYTVLMTVNSAQAINPVKSYWWLLVFPGGVFSLTLFSLNFLGDGLRDALDPRAK